MSPIVRFTEAVYTALSRHHLDPAAPRERLSYLFGRAVYGPEGLRAVLVAEAPILLADDCYIAQSGGHVALAPEVLNGVLVQFAKSDADVLINIHDHWFSAAGTRFSAVDDADDLNLARYLRDRFEPMLQRRPDIGGPRKVISLSIVLDQSSLDARYVDADGSFRPVGRIDVAATTAMRMAPNTERRRARPADDRLLRQRDFITPEQQALIADSTVAIVGCGGLGSILVENLYRLGARRFVLIDPDNLEPHNLNRWQGARWPRDIGAAKADLLARRLRAMSGGRTTVKAATLSVLAPEALSILTKADIVFGCLDNHLARYGLNRFSLAYLVPYFDAGVNIVAGDAVDFESRFFAVIPGCTACAECTAYDLLDQTEVARALMDEVTADAQRRAGYVSDQPDITAAASAYPLNQRAVSTLTIEFLNWVCGYRPLATCVAETWREGRHQRSDRANHPERPDPHCAVCAQLIGAGDHAELPRPRPAGQTMRLLAEARDKRLAASSTRHEGRTHHGPA